VEWWDACDRDVPPDDALQALPVAAGLDMAQKIDVACLTLAFRRRLDVEDTIEAVDGHTEAVKTVNLNYEVVLVPFFWIPADTMREHEQQDNVPYTAWVASGQIVATDGVSIDYTRIVRDITTKILPRFPRLRESVIGYDPAFATDIATQLRQFAGREAWCVEVLQNYTHLSEPGYVFEALVKSGRVIHGGHRVLRNHVSNVEVKTDDARRIRPVKPKRRSKHIDGVVASLMGIKMLATLPDSAPEPQLFFLGGRRGT
jgi:phage terminase large subunit-like protein